MPGGAVHGRGEHGGEAVKITADGLDIGTTIWRDDDGDVTLADLIAQAVAGQLVAQGGGELESLRDKIRAVTDEQIREQVAKRVAAALDGPAGPVPVTLAEAIRAEARAQIDKGETYQGTSTPLRQVVAAEVYTQLHDEVTGLVREARDKVRDQIREEIGTIVSRNFGTM